MFFFPFRIHIVTNTPIGSFAVLYLSLVPHLLFVVGILWVCVCYDGVYHACV